MVVNVGANSGSSVSEQHIIDSVEFVNQIRPGQIQNYVWDTATSSWIPEQAYSGDIVVVYLSGATITASVSGQVVWGAPVSGYATSGQLPVLTISGSFVTVSGTVSTSVSGNTVTTSVSGNVVSTSVSGDIVEISGQVVEISGQSVYVQTTSGSAVMNAPNVMNFGYTSAHITAFSGILLSGAVLVSSSLAATAPTKLQSVEVFFYSGIAVATQSGMQGSVIRVGAQGGISSTLVSAYFTSAYGAIIYVPATPPFVLSGDSVVASVTGLSSGNCSGMYVITRTVFGA